MDSANTLLRTPWSPISRVLVVCTLLESVSASKKLFEIAMAILSASDTQSIQEYFCETYQIPVLGS